MKEKVIVKLIKAGKEFEKTVYADYDSALNYAKKKVEQEGYKAILLRMDENKVFARTTFYPNENC